MINIVRKTSNFRREEDEVLAFKDDLSMWENMNEFRQHMEHFKWDMVLPFDVSKGHNGVGNWNKDTDFPFKALGVKVEEFRLISKNIHECLEKQNSTHIDIVLKRSTHNENIDGVIVILSTDGNIDNALYYREYETRTEEKNVYGEQLRTIIKHFRTTEYEMPLLFALDLDYIIHDKEVTLWRDLDNVELRQLLNECVEQGKNVNYEYIKSRKQQEDEEKEERRKRQEEQQKKRKAQEEKQTYESMKLMVEQMEQQRQQMMMMMAMYEQMQKQQVQAEEEYDEDDEEYDEE